MVSPLLVLGIVIALTAVAAIVSALRRKARSARIAALAGSWGLSFTADDRFQITANVAAHFPTPGVADVVLRDLVYSAEPSGRYRYIFTVEYTTGVLRTKRRRVNVATFVDHDPADDAPHVRLAPPELPLIDQYDHLRRGVGVTA